ncbi:MAG: hypothetical protein FWD10_03660, partial [Candidatus Bathyarchaeota archaeon]|nr:hypothetical protein [Candidatus Termitimicrobium sp.]
MKNKTKKSLVSIILVLALFVGCFASLTPTTSAADDSVYRIVAWVTDTMTLNEIHYTSGSPTSASSTLMKLQDQYGDVIYAVCVNQKVTTNIGVRYEMVDLENYAALNQAQKDQILAVLNYVSINYGLETAKGTALAQTVVWRIIHPDISYIIPQPGVGITRADIDEVFAHRFDLATQYNIDVTMQGTADKITEDANYAYYGPFSVSYNYALADIDFDLTFTEGSNAIFTNTNYATIQKVKPGVPFYVGVPITTTDATYSFNATASKSVNLITGMKFLVSVGSSSQPLLVYQPLVQPLVNPNGERYTYNCNYSFRVLIPGSLTVTVNATKEHERVTYQDVMHRTVWDVIQRDVWNVLQRDVWNVLQRDVWDVYQRNISDVYQRNVSDVLRRDVWDVLRRDVWDVYQRNISDVMQRNVWDVYQRNISDVYQRNAWDVYQRNISDVMQRNAWDVYQRNISDVMQRNAWDIYQRDIWDVLRRDAWDLYQRDIWDVMQRDIWDVMQRNAWDIYQRDIWDVLKRDAWDVYQRNISDVMQRNAWDIYQRDIWDVLKRDAWD